MQVIFGLLEAAWIVICSLVTSFALQFVPSRFSKKSVEGEIVLVTGGGSGFGRILAKKFALEQKAVVVIWDVNEKGMQETIREILRNGGQCYGYQVDVTSKEQVYSAAAKLQDEIGDLYMLINNAGIANGDLLLDIPDERIDKMFQVNILAHFWTVKAFLPRMLSNGKGHIVTMASAAGITGGPKLIDYSSTKFAAVGFHESLNFELQCAYPDSGIETTLLCPWFASTPMVHGKENQIVSFSFLPIHDPEPLVDEMITGILKNEYIIIPSPACKFIQFSKSILPSRTFRTLQGITGKAFRETIMTGTKFDVNSNLISYNLK